MSDQDQTPVQHFNASFTSETMVRDCAELSVRTRNNLKKAEILTFGDLLRTSEEQLLEIENFGKKSVREIQEFLQSIGAPTLPEISPVVGEPDNLSPSLLRVWREARAALFTSETGQLALNTRIDDIEREIRRTVESLRAEQNQLRHKIMESQSIELQLRRMMKFIVEQAKAEEDAELGRDLPI